eukprot:TRINITY_DN66452_c3_g1_i2.p1 TRINITY_DN66452_c3_g1~~TRINITY_DN66452_c3_g1_i2.p1  ORF type:complete len:296 (+),score=14.97 TRINITY_DN66452_c3_g1_i2:284-1171(+)
MHRTVAVTGALGNLGSKFLSHLRSKGYTKLIGLEQPGYLPEKTSSAIPSVELVRGDLGNWNDSRWQDVIRRSDAVVHFSAQNPYPEASWTDAGVSIDMVINTATAAANSPTCNRYVFATSNHVMGGYLWKETDTGLIEPSTPPEVGTKWHTGQVAMDATPYSAAKFTGERVCHHLGLSHGDTTSYVCVRIGWCQPGANLPSTMSASGTPTQQVTELAEGVSKADLERADTWYKSMWLSNRDFTQLFQRAIEAPSTSWPAAYILVNGMSNNTGMRWSLAEAREYLGYSPEDDAFAA